MLSLFVRSHESDRAAYQFLGQVDCADLAAMPDSMDAISTEEMRRRGAGGMFRLSTAQGSQGFDVRHHAVAIDRPLLNESDEILDAAYKIGILTEKTNRSAWANTRFWRFTCGLLATSVFALVALLIYWIVNIGNSFSDTLDKIQYRNPTIVQDTVDDARTLLHGAAVASHNFGEIAHNSQPALVNLTHSSSDLLGSLAHMMAKPRITIDMSNTAR